MRTLFTLLMLLTATEVYSQQRFPWTPGAMVQSEYKELAGTLIPASGSPAVVRSEGREYRLPETLSDLPEFQAKTTVIMKGIAGTVALPGRPVQYSFWPMECTIRTRRFVLPDPAPLHWQWLKGWLSRDEEPAPALEEGGLVVHPE